MSWRGGSGTRTSPSSATRRRSPTSSASTSSCATPAAATSRASARSTTRSRRPCRCRRPEVYTTVSVAARAATSSGSCRTSSTSTSPTRSSGWPRAPASSCATSRAPVRRDASPANGPAGRGARRGAALLRRAAAHGRGAQGARVPRRARLRPGRRRAVRLRVRAVRLGRADQTPAGQGFTGPELTLGGLARESGRGSLIDRFHRRLLWPIRDTGGDVVGFGARRLFDDDRVEAKYLNTPETPIYKKSQLLYGVDMAKKEIARQHRAVIVEGYTDVMACHLSGVHDRGRDVRHGVRLRARLGDPPAADGLATRSPAR